MRRKTTLAEEHIIGSLLGRVVQAKAVTPFQSPTVLLTSIRDQPDHGYRLAVFERPAYLGVVVKPKFTPALRDVKEKVRKSLAVKLSIPI